MIENYQYEFGIQGGVPFDQQMLEEFEEEYAAFEPDTVVDDEE